MRYIFILSLLSTLLTACAGESENPPLEVKTDDRPISAVVGEPIVSYADMLDKATPSVVSVYTSSMVTMRRTQRLPDIFRHFGIPTQPVEPETGTDRKRREQLGVGSGVIISEDGYIVTNHHVVQGLRGREVDQVIVRLSDQSEYEASLIGSDPKTDIAVLKIDPEVPLAALTFADSDRIRVGDVVFAIGNPFDVGLTATHGIVSATSRSQGGRILGPGSYEDFIQTDAAINRGNSGGALIDAWGRLIGINTAIVSGSGGSIGIGFAIPVNMALNVASNLIQSGEVPRGLLGLFPSDLTSDMAEAFGLDSTSGALVNQVQEDSPASRGGIVHGDIIIKIGDTEIGSASQLRLVVSQIPPGTEVAVTLIRESKTIILPIVLGSLNEKTASITGESSPIKGVSIRLIDQEARDEYSIPEDISGVLVSEVDDDSPFVEILEKGMVILEVNGASIRSVEQIESNLSEGQNMLYIWAKGTKGFMVIKQ